MREHRPEGRRRTEFIGLALLCFCVASGASAGWGQDETPTPAHSSLDITPLRELVSNVEQNSPQILAARHAWKAATQVPTQVSTLPDPQFIIQQFSVGSPRPFAGYTNSDFAYLGIGINQDLPYPGKLRLRGEIAKKDAEVTQQKYESVRRAILAAVKMAYFKLGYLAKR